MFNCCADLGPIYTETAVYNLTFVLKENTSKLLHSVPLIYE